MSQKKFVLFGTMKIMQDFEYIFKNIHIDIMICTEKISEKKAEYKGIPIVLFSTVDFNINKNSEIIVCMEPGAEREKYIKFFKKNLGVQNVNVCEKYFQEFDNGIHIPINKKIFIWGTGRSAEVLLSNIGSENTIDGYIDSYKKNINFNGKKVISYDDIEKQENSFIIIAVNNSIQIEEYLFGKGLKHGEDYCKWDEVVWSPVNMLKKVFFSKDSYDFRCNTMLNHLEICEGGNTRTCCTTFVKMGIGEYYDNDLQSIWNGKKSIIHRILALSTQNRSYAFCNKTMCPLFAGRKNKYEENLEPLVYDEISEYPEVVALGFDKSCNLACETCRKEIYVANGREKELTDKIAEKVNAEIISHCKFLIMAGDGEVFASSAYKKIWNNEEVGKIDCIRLLTNGTLFNEENWQKFSQNKSNVKIMLTVSIDAATLKTYGAIRRYGDFDQLKKNMIFAGKLRKEKKLAYFRMNFVVQKKNIKEMIPFVQWGKNLGADKVFFTKILNWGTYDEKDFQENVSPMEKDGITPIAELKEVIGKLEMQDPIVDLGTIQYMHKTNTDDYVKNYYEWELEKDVAGLFE